MLPAAVLDCPVLRKSEFQNTALDPLTEQLVLLWGAKTVFQGHVPARIRFAANGVQDCSDKPTLVVTVGWSRLLDHHARWHVKLITFSRELACTLLRCTCSLPANRFAALLPFWSLNRAEVMVM